MPACVNLGGNGNQGSNPNSIRLPSPAPAAPTIKRQGRLAPFFSVSQYFESLEAQSFQSVGPMQVPLVQWPGICGQRIQSKLWALHLHQLLSRGGKMCLVRKSVVCVLHTVWSGIHKTIIHGPLCMDSSIYQLTGSTCTCHVWLHPALSRTHPLQTIPLVLVHLPLVLPPLQCAEKEFQDCNLFPLKSEQFGVLCYLGHVLVLP